MRHIQVRALSDEKPDHVKEKGEGRLFSKERSICWRVKAVESKKERPY